MCLKNFSFLATWYCKIAVPSPEEYDTVSCWRKSRELTRKRTKYTDIYGIKRGGSRQRYEPSCHQCFALDITPTTFALQQNTLMKWMCDVMHDNALQQAHTNLI